MTMKKHFKIFLFRLLATFARNSGDASILMYHSVGENDALFTVPPSMLEKQLQYLHSNGYKTVCFSELVRRIKAREDLSRTVCLTFDDGYVDNYTVLFPLLSRYKMPATIFITTERVGSTFTISSGITLPMMSKEQIQEMHQSGLVEFLPHGHTHRNLDILTYEETSQEIRVSESILSEITQRVPKLFAYPRGRYNRMTVQVLKDLGYDAAVTVRPGLIKSTENDLYELSRNHIDRETSMPEFNARLGRSGVWYETLKVWR